MLRSQAEGQILSQEPVSQCAQAAHDNLIKTQKAFLILHKTEPKGLHRAGDSLLSPVITAWTQDTCPPYRQYRCVQVSLIITGLLIENKD